jgi:hypothetical protein
MKTLIFNASVFCNGSKPLPIKITLPSAGLVITLSSFGPLRFGSLKNWNVKIDRIKAKKAPKNRSSISKAKNTIKLIAIKGHPSLAKNGWG